MRFEKVVRNSHYILIGIIATFVVLSFLPMVGKISEYRIVTYMMSQPYYYFLCIITFGMLIISIPLYSYLIHDVFIPHFVAMVDPVLTPVRISKYSLYVIAVLLLCELAMPFKFVKDLLHTFSIMFLIVHVLAYNYVIRVSPFTLQFLFNYFQTTKILLSANLFITVLVGLICKNGLCFI